MKKFFLKTWMYVYDCESSLALPFFGLSFLDVGNKKITVKDFFENLAGWDEKRFTLLINILRAIVIFPLNILLILPRIILNILKLVTEFLPFLMVLLIATLVGKMEKNLGAQSNYSQPTQILITVGIMILAPFLAIFGAVYLLGRAITSPQKNIELALKKGQEWGGPGIVGKLLSAALCIFSIAITLFAYLILFPITIKLAVAHMPSMIVTGIQNTLNFFAPLSKLGAPFSVIMNPIFHAMGPFFAKAGSQVILGIAAVTTIAAGPFVVLLNQIDKGFEILSTKWRRWIASEPFKNFFPKVKSKAQPAKGFQEELQRRILQQQQLNIKPQEAEKPVVQPQPRVVQQPQKPQNIKRPQQVFWKPPEEKKPKLLPPPKHHISAIIQNLMPPKPKQKIDNPKKALKSYPKIPETDLDISWDPKLGEGGFGAVYKGVYKTNGQSIQVAVKVSKQSFYDDKIRAEMQREMTTMAQVSNSPYIVHFYGFCVTEVAIVMEYMAQGSLWDLLHAKNPHYPCPDEKTRYKLGKDAGQGVMYLHLNGIVHADLKSLNILVNEKFEAKVSDFGLSKITEKLNPNRTAVTQHGPSNDCVGTWGWMAPELFGTDPRTTPKSDTYSYGVILWELYAREQPLKGMNNIFQVKDKVQGGQRDPIPVNMPPTMQRFTKSCWSLQPEQRPEMKTIVEGLEDEYKTYNFKP